MDQPPSLIDIVEEYFSKQIDLKYSFSQDDEEQVRSKNSTSSRNPNMGLNLPYAQIV